MSTPSADVSVRVAWADDAIAIATLQVRAWRDMYAALLPPGSLPADPEITAAQWRTSLIRPQDARQRLLVALERNRVVGYVMTAPASDPDCDPIRDGELCDLTIDPDERGKGHGSRLLQAAVDTLQADHLTRAVTWLAGADDVQRRFFDVAGWAPDGAHRELDLDGTGATTFKQIRLHSAIE